jgi:hypothetical protein
VHGHNLSPDSNNNIHRQNLSPGLEQLGSLYQFVKAHPLPSDNFYKVRCVCIPACYICVRERECVCVCVCFSFEMCIAQSQSADNVCKVRYVCIHTCMLCVCVCMCVCVCAYINVCVCLYL